jgi:pyruvate/2-oxoglutarate dehydrogenase complex dihydrolipoamide dehydrogenase (E3) component
MNEV